MPATPCFRNCLIIARGRVASWFTRFFPFERHRFVFASKNRLTIGSIPHFFTMILRVGGGISVSDYLRMSSVHVFF